MRAVQRQANTPEAAAEIAQAEERLFDRAKTCFFTVEEYESQL
jgi:hypothetical protein